MSANFRSDNETPVAEPIMQALAEANRGTAWAYAEDDWSLALNRAFGDPNVSVGLELKGPGMPRLAALEATKAARTEYARRHHPSPSHPQPLLGDLSRALAQAARRPRTSFLNRRDRDPNGDSDLEEGGSFDFAGCPS